MGNKNEMADQPMSPGLVITRSFHAPIRLVFEAWTNADNLAKWWGPKEAEISVDQSDIHPGGIFLYSMQFPGQPRIWGRFEYQELVPPERLVFISSFSDENGNIIRNPWSPQWPLEILNIVTLSERDGLTTLTIKGYPVNANDEERDTFASATQSMNQGFKGTFDKLEEHLSKQINKHHGY